ncbi:MAG: Uma2 family endonuclease [Chitinophagaceae bacterium]
MLKILSWDDYTMELEVPGFKNMSDNAFFTFCEKNRRIRIERNEHRQIYILPPVGCRISIINASLSSSVCQWNSTTKAGKTFGSDAGYYLPDGSMRSPDTSWMSNKKWEALSANEKQQFPYVVPEFIIELVPTFEKLEDVRYKMTKWIENGVLLGWLIDPKIETTFIYRANGSVVIITSFDKKLSGEDVLTGFELDLTILK